MSINELTLNRNERALARYIFKLRVHQSEGQAYEDLFVQIMTYSNPNFTPIEAYGNIGDRKNDGYDKTQGTYYQIFAPQDLAKSYTKRDAIIKAEKDFIGLKAFWDTKHKINNYYFVINDKYKGSLADIEEKLEEIQRIHSLSLCNCFSAKDLEDIFFNLPADQVIVIIGSIPDSSSIGQLDYRMMTDVIRHISENQSSVDPLTNYSLPTMSDKIIFNGLVKTRALLETGSYQTGAVEDYFSKNSGVSAQDIRDDINQIYLTSKEKDFPDEGNKGDYIFIDILNAITGSKPTKALQDAAIVLMAYFFESCDIFEPPISTIGGE